MLAVSAAGCGGAAETFDPAGPCVVDGRVPGAYPELEARLPGSLDGNAPGNVDSGRNCSDGALGSLISHDVDEIRFAGATWDLGGGLAVSSVVFATAAGDLPAAWIAEFYEIGARTAKRHCQHRNESPGLRGRWRDLATRHPERPVLPERGHLAGRQLRPGRPGRDSGRAGSLPAGARRARGGRHSRLHRDPGRRLTPC